jgi:hypothetical protein
MSHLIQIAGPSEGSEFTPGVLFVTPISSLAIATVAGPSIVEIAELNGFSVIQSADGHYFRIEQDEPVEVDDTERCCEDYCEQSPEPEAPSQPDEAELNVRIVEQSKRLILNTLSKPTLLQPQEVDTCLKLSTLLTDVCDRAGIK